MMYIDFTAGNKDYKLRLSIRATVALEKQLGVNPLMIFGNGETIPTITTMVQVLHAALQQYNHGISMDDAYSVALILGLNFNKFSLEEFTDGINIELEHGLRDKNTNVTDNDLLKTAKIALAHLNEFPNYYNQE